MQYDYIPEKIIAIGEEIDNINKRLIEFEELCKTNNNKTEETELLLRKLIDLLRGV